MRLFTAIDIPQPVLSKLSALLDLLRPAAKLRWSPAENLHVTTKFIGEWPENKLGEMHNALAAVAMPAAAILTVRGLGWFPNPHSPRVFWVGVDAGGELNALAQAIDRAVTRLGVPAEERPFRPHLTLARLKHRNGLDAVRRVVAGLDSTDFGSFQASSFFLYLSAAGKYTRLREFSFVQS